MGFTPQNIFTVRKRVYAEPHFAVDKAHESFEEQCEELEESRSRRDSGAFPKGSSRAVYIPRYASRSYIATTTPQASRFMQAAIEDCRKSQTQVTHDDRHSCAWDESGSTANRKRLIMANALGEVPHLTQENLKHHESILGRSNIIETVPMRDTRRQSTALEDLANRHKQGSESNNPYRMTVAPTYLVDVSEGRNGAPQASRPTHRPSDRPDWEQASQAGDDLGHFLHLHSGQWKDSESRAVQSNLSSTSQALAANTMIAEAVRLVKQEERQKRRSSFVGFFKRH